MSCKTCLSGYKLNGNSCMADTSCNNDNNGCLVCPFGSSLSIVNNNSTRLSQKCVNCSTANCARCNISKPSQCYSCKNGYYLDENENCEACLAGCGQCIDAEMCSSCAMGYIPTQSGKLSGNMVLGVFNCTPC